MINMLIDTYHHFSSPMLSHNVSGSIGSSVQGILTRDGGFKPYGGVSKDDTGPSRIMDNDCGDQMVLEFSKPIVVAQTSTTLGPRDKGKQKVGEEPSVSVS